MSYPHSTSVAMPALVQHAPGPLSGISALTPSLTAPNFSRPQLVTSPESHLLAPNCMDAAWLNPEEQVCLEQDRQVPLPTPTC